MWESFIREKDELRFVLKVLDNLRLALFLVPSLAPIIWRIWKGPEPQHPGVVRLLFTLEVILLCLFIWLWKRIKSYGDRLCEKTK